jgi:hypothetical protein
MPDPPSKPKRDKRPEAHPNASPSSPPEPVERAAEAPKPDKPIAILAEREIPFEEERPPNFSPHFQIRVHRVRRPEKPREVKQ